MQPQVIVTSTSAPLSARPIFREGGVSEIRFHDGAPASPGIFEMPSRRQQKPATGDWRQPDAEDAAVLRCRMN